MWKRLLSIVLLISFFSFSFCFAFDFNAVKQEWTPKITHYWNNVLNWTNTDLKPWIGKNLGEKTKKEFEREFGELVRDVPVALQSLWVNIKAIFKL